MQTHSGIKHNIKHHYGLEEYYRKYKNLSQKELWLLLVTAALTAKSVQNS
jgi:hypothetical protein